MWMNKFHTSIKMLTLRDLETYLMVKDYMEEKDINIEELIESMDCKKVPIAVTCDGVIKKFYSLAFAARYMGVSLPTVYYAYSKKSDTIVRRKGGPKEGREVLEHIRICLMEREFTHWE